MARKIAEREDVIPVLGELFREHGFAGTSLSEITRKTGLGKGSLYHFFPQGKEEMARVVLDDVSAWFEENVFVPLRQSDDADAGLEHMFEAVDRFFQSGRRICLVGTFSLDDSRDRFAEEVQNYFADWIKALTGSLKRKGFDARSAREVSEDIVAGIQGALVLARSQNDSRIFTRSLKRFRARTKAPEHDG